MLYIFGLTRERNVLIAGVLHRVQPWLARKSLFLPPHFSLLWYKPVPFSTSLGVRYPHSFTHSEGKKGEERSGSQPLYKQFESFTWGIQRAEIFTFKRICLFRNKLTLWAPKQITGTTTKSSVLPKLQAGICQGEWWSKKSGVLTGKGGRKKEWKV